jgi:hypothetical protein
VKGLWVIHLECREEVQTNTLPTAADVLWHLVKLYIFMLEVNDIEVVWQPIIVQKKTVVDKINMTVLTKVSAN